MKVENLHKRKVYFQICEIEKINRCNVSALQSFFRQEGFNTRKAEFAYVILLQSKIIIILCNIIPQS